MKRKAYLGVILALAALLSSCASCNGRDAAATPYETSHHSGGEFRITSVEKMNVEMRGAWIATVHNINFPSAPDLPAEQLRSELDGIISVSSELGLNTLFFQAHPSSDALYRSELFPVSRFLTTGGSLYFDPLKYITAECHKRGMRVFAWVNPFRVTTDRFESRDEALAAHEDVPAKEMTVYYNDGRLYYDPGNPEVTELISDCVAEIVSAYDVDGIVFDDYFYPYPSGDAPFDDSESYEKYADGADLETWRRENINRLIRTCRERIRESAPGCLFGVAPFGIWRNDDGENGGSATAGLESYDSLYCDTLEWAEKGYVDFISPQLYWSNDESAAPFDVLCEWWDSALWRTGVDFIPSLAAYKYDEGWDEPSGKMTGQISLCRSTSTYRGAVYYGFGAISADSNGIQGEIAALNDELYLYSDSVRYPTDLRAGGPDTGTLFTTSTVEITGISPPKSALKVNQVPLGCGTGGEFVFRALLSPGENLISVTCGTQSKVLRMFLR